MGRLWVGVEDMPLQVHVHGVAEVEVAFAGGIAMSSAGGKCCGKCLASEEGTSWKPTIIHSG